MASKSNDWVVTVNLEGEPGEKATIRAYAFDALGSPLASARLTAKGEAKLSIPAEVSGRSIKLLVGPDVDDPKTATPRELRRLGAYERFLRVDFEDFPTLEIPEWGWSPWFPCTCQVRGRVVSRLDLPDGTSIDLPICNARVTICEVDRIPRIIWHLPDDIIWRLKDELLEVLRPPIPLPDPPLADPPLPEGPPFPPPPPRWGIPDPANPGLAVPRLAEVPVGAMSTQLRSQIVTTRSAEVISLETARSATRIRATLVDLSDLLLPYICWWDWLWPWFTHRKDCIKTVEVDETGHFSTSVFHDCSDAPDLYFSVEQLIDGTWETIYSPPVACNTHWDYECGSEVTIYVTDPKAVPCVPPPDVEPPPGTSVWVMPYAVGKTKIWGTPPGSPSAPTGWVRSDGFTDYDGGDESPFGKRLGLRMLSSSVIPYSGLEYYRWSYRKQGTTGWTPLLEDVVRHYVRELPGVPHPSFPVYPLGPKPGDVFEFRPHAAPGPESSDPAGTQHYWPTDEGLGDIYSGFMTTQLIEPDAGEYEIKLEVFDSSKNPVSPGSGTFDFVVPTGVASDGTIFTRLAEPFEIDGDGFVFRLQIDNNECQASIPAPHVDASTPTDPCGFVRYESGDSVHVAFHAHHPNGHARFTFNMVRGATNVPAAGVGLSDVDVVPVAGAYASDGLGNFSNDFAVGALLDACENAAFAERVRVDAKATTGWERIQQYDAHDLRAFALAELDEDEE